MDAVEIFDTTLRDGLQVEGVSASVEDKLRIAQQLDLLGVRYIEGGWPGANPKDIEFFARARDELDLATSTLVAFGSTRRPKGKVDDDATLRNLIEAGTDADEARLWFVGDVLDGRLELAFDHDLILRDAVEQARDQLEGSDLATAFVGPTFTLSELQSVYEAIWDDELDTANFRRSLSLSPPDASYVIATGERAAAGPKGGRPPELFEAGDAWTSGSPVRRIRRRTPDPKSGQRQGDT